MSTPLNGPTQWPAVHKKKTDRFLEEKEKKGNEVRNGSARGLRLLTKNTETSPTNHALDHLYPIRLDFVCVPPSWALGTTFQLTGGIFMGPLTWSERATLLSSLRTLF